MADKSNTRGKFIKEFMKEKKQVGAVAPSSKQLCNKMCKPIDFVKAEVIVELGPGTGVVTRELVSRMNPDTRLLVLETNKTFYESLKEEFKDNKNIHLYNRSAEDIIDVLKENELNEESVDAVVSSLPLTVIPNEIVNKIVINSKKSLKVKGQYIQFQYSLNAKKLLKRVFKEVKISFTPINMPPAFIYTCKK